MFVALEDLEHLFGLWVVCGEGFAVGSGGGVDDGVSEGLADLFECDILVEQ
jgi:hypothetical protein